MKLALLKFGNILTYTMIGATGLYSVASLLYGVLPMDVTQPVIDTLNMNAQAIVPIGVSSAVTSVGLVGLKVSAKALADKLKTSNLAFQLREAELIERINLKEKLNENVNDSLVLKQNQIIKNQEEITKQNQAIINFNVANAERQLHASDQLVPPQVKALYQNALGSLKTLSYDVNPIIKIVQETIIKEVEKPVEQSKVNW